MSEAWFREWDNGILRRPEGDTSVELRRTERSLPQTLALYVDDDWLEDFQLAGWENGCPVYASRGYLPRI